MCVYNRVSSHAYRICPPLVIDLYAWLTTPTMSIVFWPNGLVLCSKHLHKNRIEVSWLKSPPHFNDKIPRCQMAKTTLLQPLNKTRFVSLRYLFVYFRILHIGILASYPGVFVSMYPCICMCARKNPYIPVFRVNSILLLTSYKSIMYLLSIYLYLVFT